MEIKPEELLYKLQQQKELPEMRLLTVWGEEDFYRSQIAAAVPDYVFFGTEAADREITIFAKDTDLRQLAGAINSYPFFSGRSLIIISDDKLLSGKQDSDNRKEQLNKLADILADIPDYCTVLLNASKLDKRTKLYKLLQKNGLMCECKVLRTYELGPWLNEQARAWGGRFDQEAIGTIMEYLAPVEKAPLQLLQQEIAKLAVYAGDRHTWTRRDVEEIFAALPEASSFALSNSVAEGRLTEALQILAGERKKGTNILPLCALLQFKLRQMLQFMELHKQHYDAKTIASMMGAHPFAVRKLQEQCRRYRAASLQQALLAISQLNIDLRQGGRDYARLEEILVQLLG